MSYFDPKIYNYESLTADTDRCFIDGYDAALAEIESLDILIGDQLCTEYEDEESATGKLKREFISAVCDCLYGFLDRHRTELIASLMESRGDDE